MKKVLLAATLLFSLGAVKAQVKYGVKAGLNLASMKESYGGVNVTTDSRANLIAGAFLNYALSENFSIQPELLYSGMGGSYSGEKLKLAYIALPILAQYHFAEKFYVEAGPQFGLLMSAKADGTDVKDSFKSLDIQLVPGVGYNITENIGVNARYGFSLGNIADGSDGTAKNRAFSFMVAYTF
ncbi:MAG TPA: porin family protein [Chitinophagaceae bacterium]|jgi:hypothetical protein|nr:porin family protein [Chitinophagaceae bacterium]